MLAPDQTLAYYQHPAIQAQILAVAQGRELWLRKGEVNGPRPDVLRNQADVGAAARQGATSFHISEERWSDPLALGPGLHRSDLDELRVGWDLIIDIDCPYWQYSKLIAKLMIDTLRDEGVRSISLKFSGNKGFHIGVPFEAFPSHYRGQPMAKLFPEAPKAVLSYLLEIVAKRFQDAASDSLLATTGLSLDALKVRRCVACGKKVSRVVENHEYACRRCDTRWQGPYAGQYRACERCRNFMDHVGLARRAVCPVCRGEEFVDEDDLTPLMNLDEGLVSSRHMIRCAYSLHEKSGLVSVALDPDAVMGFEREQAAPEALPDELRPFLVREAAKDEALPLLERAMARAQAQERREEQARGQAKEVAKEFLKVSAPIDPAHFPPCIKLILAGIKDGKKRALFILINFLGSVGWDEKRMEDELLAWNERNSPPLRKGMLLSALRGQKETVLPPNCANKPYYLDIGVCRPDGLCATIRNPANYAIKRARSVANETKKPRQKPAA